MSYVTYLALLCPACVIIPGNNLQAPVQFSENPLLECAYVTYEYVTDCYVHMRTAVGLRNTNVAYAYSFTHTLHMTMLMWYVCVQLYAYVTYGQFSMKLSYDMYEPYTYVTLVYYIKRKSIYRER